MVSMARRHQPQSHRGRRRRVGTVRTEQWAGAVREERDWMRRRAGLRQCMDHDAGSGCGCLSTTRARRLLCFGAEEAWQWGRRRCRSCLRRTHAAALIASADSSLRRVGSGAVVQSTTSTASDRDHVPVGHGTAAKLPRCGLYCHLFLATREEGME